MFLRMVGNTPQAKVEDQLSKGIHNLRRQEGRKEDWGQFFCLKNGEKIQKRRLIHTKLPTGIYISEIKDAGV